MATAPITIARIFLREGEHLLGRVVEVLHDQEKVAGLTVWQGITGFGADGAIRSSHLLDLSLDLPLVIEFYDEPERVARVIDHLQNRLGLAHIVSWPGSRHVPG